MRTATTLTAAVLTAGCIGVVVLASSAKVAIPLRTRVQPFKASNTWQPVTVQGAFLPEDSAIIVCDMWDKHWCAGATQRVEDLARRMDPVLRQARRTHVLVIHAPSETMDFYKGYPQRRMILGVTGFPHTESLVLPDPPLPIDDSDGGCDTRGDKEHAVWKRENPLLSIGAEDAISDNGNEIYNLLRQRNIHTLFIMGVHANMCILNRSFAIKQMTKWGFAVYSGTRSHGRNVQSSSQAFCLARRRNRVGHGARREILVSFGAQRRSRISHGSGRRLGSKHPAAKR